MHTKTEGHDHTNHTQSLEYHALTTLSSAFFVSTCAHAVKSYGNCEQTISCTWRIVSDEMRTRKYRISWTNTHFHDWIICSHACDIHIDNHKYAPRRCAYLLWMIVITAESCSSSFQYIIVYNMVQNKIQLNSINYIHTILHMSSSCVTLSPVRVIHMFQCRFHSDRMFRETVELSQ